MSDYDKIKQLILTLEWENVQLAIELDKGLKTGAVKEMLDALPKFKSAVNPSTYGIVMQMDYKRKIDTMEVICSISSLEIIYKTERIPIFVTATDDELIRFADYFNRAKKHIAIRTNKMLHKRYKYIHYYPF